MKKRTGFLWYLLAAEVTTLLVWTIDSAAMHYFSPLNLLIAFYYPNAILLWMFLFGDKKRRGALQIAEGSLIGAALYTMIVFGDAFTTVNKVLYTVGTAIVIACIALYILTGKRKWYDDTYFDFLFRRFEDSFNLSCLLLGGMALIVCTVQPILFFKQYTFASLSQVNAQATIDATYPKEVTYGDEYRLAENIEVIRPLLDSDAWNDSTIEQRQEAAEALIRCEGRYLGITAPVTVCFSDDMKKTMGGYYSDDDRTITVNNYYIREDIPFYSLETCLHEIRHCYQHDMMRIYKKLDPEERNLLPFYNVEKWLVNSVNYKRAEYDGMEEYKNQELETDARDYADRMVVEYLELLQEMDAEEAQG